MPFVVTERGTDINLIPQYARPRKLIQDAAAKADGMVAVCQALKDAMVDLGIPADRVTVLRNGVDLDRFRPLERQAACQALGFGRPTLVSVGHLVERKGNHHILSAL